MSSAAAHCSAWCSASATDTPVSSVRGRWLPLALRLLVGLEVVLEVNSCRKRAVGLLRSVLDVDLRKRQAHRLRTVALFAIGIDDRRDDHVVHLDDEKLLL